MKFALQIKATLENVQTISTAPDFTFLLKLKCSNCGEISDKWHDVVESVTFPTKTSKSDVHYMEKCKLCSRENSLEIVKGSFSSYSDSDQNKFKTVAMFECRGLSPVEFSPEAGQWLAEASESSKKFELTLEGTDWSDYDDSGNQAVGIYDFESKIISVK